ncbi:MAG TPA: NUDIX domain-containing protein [Opitutaceae bacterium]|nr:NUDIX domain-containing protein [Opitutaceae bacterium]
MAKPSAGLLPYRPRDGAIEIFLVHPGGPFWAKKDAAAWSIAKGEFADDEEPLAAAQREFAEETGLSVGAPFLSLGTVKSGGKTVHAFAVAAHDLDPEKIVSNAFQLEWPPRSGRMAEFPEIDRAAWFSLEAAAEKIHRGQLEFLARLRAALSSA